MNNAQGKFTKGPWQISGGRTILANGSMVASIQRKVSADEEVANARLISAAPDLFAALQCAIQAGEAELKRNACAPTPAWLDEARAALAKASGQ